MQEIIKKFNLKIDLTKAKQKKKMDVFKQKKSKFELFNKFQHFRPHKFKIPKKFRRKHKKDKSRRKIIKHFNTIVLNSNRQGHYRYQTSEK